MFVYIMTMFVYTLAGQGVLTNIGTTELDEQCSGVALIYLIEHMLARSFPQLGNLDVSMLIESRLSNDESAPGCTTRVLNLHAPHAQLEWLVPFMPFSWRTSLPLLSNPERDHRHASIRQHACVRTRRGPQHACAHTGRA